MESGTNTNEFNAPEITTNNKGELINGTDTLNQQDMLVHVDGKNPNKSQFLYDVDANKAVLDASAYANNEYDECGFLSSIKTVDTDSKIVAKYDYTRGSNGEITTIEETILHSDGTLTRKNTSYTYDNVNRLVKEAICNENGSITFTYEYDENYNRSLQKTEFTGNTEDLLDETGKEEVEAGKTVYTYNDCNQLIQESRETEGGTVKEIQYEYDLEGNLVTVSSKENTITYTYDCNENMISATIEKTTEGSTIKTEETYGYDAEGVRVFKESDGVKTIYLVDKSETYTHVLAERKSSGETFYYTRGIGLNARTEKTTGEKTFYLYDGHGNVRTLTDIEGNVTDCYSYNAYGTLLIKEGNAENSYLYCGEQMDYATGLYYLRARYLNPFTGTFTQKDTYEGELYSPVTQNGYLYTAGNPVMYVDPSGNIPSLNEEAISLTMVTLLSISVGLCLRNLMVACINMHDQVNFPDVGTALETFKNKMVGLQKDMLSNWEILWVPKVIKETIIDSIPAQVQEVMIDIFPTLENEVEIEVFPATKQEGLLIIPGPNVVERNFKDMILTQVSNSGVESGRASELPTIEKGTKEWDEAVKSIANGGNTSYRTKTATEAKELLNEARGNMNRYKQYTSKQYKKGYEMHPNEINTRNAPHNDLPHVKWKDWLDELHSGKGHIFFDKPN